jgi:hypothetical protein
MAFYCGALDRALTLAELGAQDGAAGPELDLLRASVHVARSDAAAAADALELYESRAERSSALDALAAYLHARIGANDAAARLADAVLGVDRQGGASAATQSFALMATGDYLSALRTLFAGRAEPGTGAAARLVAGIIRNAWVDPVLNEPAFREVRQDLMLR